MHFSLVLLPNAEFRVLPWKRMTSLLYPIYSIQPGFEILNILDKHRNFRKPVNKNHGALLVNIKISQSCRAGRSSISMKKCVTTSDTLEKDLL